jgi:hypothetical protein
VGAHVYHRKLARVLERMGGYYTVQDILAEIANGTMQGFVHGDSWVITKIANYPRTKVLQIVVAVGDLDDVLAIHPRLVDFAAEVGASVIQSYGRKGWLKAALERGWKVKSRGYIFQREQ